MQHRRFFIRLKLGEDVKISGQTTDSGGGDVGHSLMKELQKLYIIDPNHFEVSFCALHGVQLTFANPIKTVYGEGRIGKRNAMQLLFVTYATQENPKDERT